MAKDPFSAANVARAIDRLPRSSSDEIEALLATATAHDMADLAEACRAELKIRPIPLGRDQAARSAEVAARVGGLPLDGMVRMAFREVPPSGPERIILQAIAATPDISYKDLRAIYGKDDLGLAIGHLVYDRYGYFRAAIAEEEDQSSVLLTRDRHGRSVTYRLKPAVEAALRDLAIV